VARKLCSQLVGERRKLGAPRGCIRARAPRQLDRADMRDSKAANTAALPPAK
jgi:hypothetical protein